MKDYKKFFMLLVVAAVLIAASLYLSLSSNKPALNQTVENATIVKAKEIIYNAINLGYNRSDYTYHFVENVNGYAQEYILVKNGNISYVWIDDQLGKKRIYFAENRSFLCVEYEGVERCSETTNNTESALMQYYNYLKSRFFKDDNILNERRMFEELFNKGYINVKGVKESAKYGKKCLAVEYSLNYSNMSVSEAERYGIMPNTPKYFDWTICEADNLPFYKAFSYSYNGVTYAHEVVIKEFSKPQEIVLPENLTEGAYSLLVREMQAQGSLAECFRKEKTADKEYCLSNFAFQFSKPNICLLAGSQKDKCIARLITFVKDEKWCEKIEAPDMKDGCYVDLAGVLKNQSYCSKIMNATIQEYCLSIATKNESNESVGESSNLELPAEEQTSEQNASATQENTSNSSSSITDERIRKILEELEKDNQSG